MKIHVIGAFLAGLLAALPAKAEAICAFEGEPIVLAEDGNPHETGSRLLQVWEVSNDKVLWSHTAPKTGDYSRFRAQVAELNLETDPVRLLKRSPTNNNLLVISKAEEWIGPAGCLEMLLIGYQHARMNTFEAPTEFASMVLRSPDGERLRVYYYTNNYDGIGRTDPIVEPVLEDRKQGWEVLVAMHSHVFHPGQPELDGLLAPSEPDADFHVRFHEVSEVREAWITNGIDTVRMPAETFHDFTRPSEGGEQRPTE